MTTRQIRRVDCDECGAHVLLGEDQYPKAWVELEVSVRKQGDDPDKSVLAPVDQDSGDFCGLRCAKAFLLKFADKLPAGSGGTA